jgi:hypothetical protein
MIRCVESLCIVFFLLLHTTQGCRKPMLGKRLDQSKLVTERRFNGILITKGQGA